MWHCSSALWRLTCGAAQCNHFYREGSVTFRNCSRMGELCLSKVRECCVYCRLGGITLYLHVSRALSVCVDNSALWHRILFWKYSLSDPVLLFFHLSYSVKLCICNRHHWYFFISKLKQTSLFLFGRKETGKTIILSMPSISWQYLSLHLLQEFPLSFTSRAHIQLVVFI